MSLPAEWTDKIFKKLTLIYGRDFAARWEGMNIVDVKTDWSHELAGFETRPKAIAWALQNLPAAKPPTVLEFRRLANTLPAEAVPELEYAKAGQERIAQELAKLAPVRAQPLASGKDWAHRIMARKAAGENINRFALTCAQSALGMAA